MMEAREQYCRSESARLADRGWATAGKVERTKNMVLYYLLSRDLKKIEGYQFTLRAQKNSQDSVRITDEAAVPKCYCRIEAREAAAMRNEQVTGAEVRRGSHLRVAREELRGIATSLTGFSR
jgi:hypothetical protein